MSGETAERGPVVKVRAIGLGRPITIGAGEAQGPFSGVGAIRPPYNISSLLRWVEDSDALRACIDAYATNIDGFGHRIEPAIDLRADSAGEEVAAAVFAHQLLTAGIEPELLEGPALDDELAQVARTARVERARAEAFFSNCAYEPGMSFPKLRRETRRHVESCGNAYWEVLRNRRGEISRFKLMPPQLSWLMPLDAGFTMFEDWERTSPIHTVKTSVPKRARRLLFMEEHTLTQIYLKDLGDPRVLSAQSGLYYTTRDEMAQAEPQATSANEYIHWKIDAVDTPYGVPRWVGSLPDIMGVHKASRVNLLFFDNKSIPPLAILVSGGVLADGAAAALEKYIEENIKGAENYHKILIIEAESDGKTGSAVRVEIKPLTSEIQKDGLFLEYSQRGIDRVGSQFRLPRFLRGDDRELNRATADAALRFGEDQVFAPERDDFDHYINDRIMPDIGCSFYGFRSLTPVTRDPERLSKVVKEQVLAGTITPRDGRSIIEDAFNRRLPPINEPWMDQPIALTLADTQNGGLNAQREGDEVDAEAEARRLLGVKARFDKAHATAAERRMAMAREYQRNGELEEITLTVSAAKMRELVRVTGE